MVNVYHKFTIEANAAKVYQLLTTVPGIKKWWMKESRGEAGKLHGELEFGQKESFYNKVKVSELEENKKVVWEVLESIGPTEDSKKWIGTRIEFDLEEKKLERLGGKTATIVLFKHGEWPSGSENTKFFAECNWHWAFFTSSLKDVAEGHDGKSM